MLAQLGVGVNHPGQPLGLVVGQGVHRIDQNGFDPGCAAVAKAVVENRIKVTFGFAGPGAGRHQGGLRLRPFQPGKRYLLMQIRRVFGGNFWEKETVAGTPAKRQLNRKKRPFGHSARPILKALHHAVEQRRGNGKGGAQKIFDSLFELYGED